LEWQPVDRGVRAKRREYLFGGPDLDDVAGAEAAARA
jgi:hypothetical protein